MNHPTDQARLLSDILAETAPSRFREDLLGETLRLVKHRRWVRRLRRTATVLAVVGLLGMLTWVGLVIGERTSTPSARSYLLVRTAPFPKGAIITTQPLSGNRIVGSVVSVVRTTPDGARSHLIDDDTLLALVAPRPAALVRIGPHSARLIFVEPNGSANSKVN